MPIISLLSLVFISVTSNLFTLLPSFSIFFHGLLFGPNPTFPYCSWSKPNSVVCGFFLHVWLVVPNIWKNQTGFKPPRYAPMYGSFTNICPKKTPKLVGKKTIPSQMEKKQIQTWANVARSPKKWSYKPPKKWRYKLTNHHHFRPRHPAPSSTWRWRHWRPSPPAPALHRCCGATWPARTWLWEVGKIMGFVDDWTIGFLLVRWFLMIGWLCWIRCSSFFSSIWNIVWSGVLMISGFWCSEDLDLGISTSVDFQQRDFAWEAESKEPGAFELIWKSMDIFGWIYGG